MQARVDVWEHEVTPFKAVPLSETLSVTGQISPDDLQAIAAAGFKSLVCNRPDGESPGQFSSQDIATAANAAGLKLAYLRYAISLALGAFASGFKALARSRTEGRPSRIQPDHLGTTRATIEIVMFNACTGILP